MCSRKRILRMVGGLFYVVLPGVRATLEDRADGTFVLQTLDADLAYLQAQKDRAKPGLWRVKEDSVTFQEDGAVKREKNRMVVIADRAADTPAQVAKYVRAALEKVDNTLKMAVAHSGFDLHYTPGSGIVGLKSARKALDSGQDKEIVESAILLANAISRVSSVPGVTWFSDWGGSAVLTRALQILSNEKSVSLENHRIVLNRPTTSSSLATKLAKELNVELIEKKVGITPKEIVGNHLSSGVSLKGMGQAGVFGISAASAAFSVIEPGAGFIAIAAKAVGFAGAMYFVGASVVSGTKNLSGKKYK